MSTRRKKFKGKEHKVLREEQALLAAAPEEKLLTAHQPELLMAHEEPAAKASKPRRRHSAKKKVAGAAAAAAVGAVGVAADANAAPKKAKAVPKPKPEPKPASATVHHHVKKAPETERVHEHKVPEAAVVDEPIASAPRAYSRQSSGNGGIIAAAIIAAVCLIGLLCCLAFINDSQDPYYTNAEYQSQHLPPAHPVVPLHGCPMGNPPAPGYALPNGQVPAYYIVGYPAQGFNPTAVQVVYHNGHYYPVSGASLPPAVPVNSPYGAPGNAARAAASQAPVVVYLFNFDSDGVPENTTLTALANAARKSGKTVYVHAYTDDNGDQAYNQALSTRRAKALEQYMTSHGVPAGKVKSAGHGPTHQYPTDLQNRRAEITMK